MITTSFITRESECGDCERCGRNLSQRENGIPIEEALAAVFAQPDLLEPMLFRACAGCGAPYEWDVAVMVDERDDQPSIPGGREADLHREIRGLLERSIPLAESAEHIRGHLGIVGILIEEGSGIERRPQRIRDRRGPIGPG